MGKSCLVERFLGGEFNSEYVATLQDDYIAKCNVNGDSLEMNITDFAGEHDDLVSIEVPDVFVVCFSLVDKDSLESVLNFWVPRIRSEEKQTPIVLVGTQLDKRRTQRKGHILPKKGSVSLSLSALQPTWNVRQKTTQGWMLRFTASFWRATSTAEGKPVSLNAFLADELINI